MDGFLGHSNSRGCVDSERLLCWTRAELQVPLVYLLLATDGRAAMRGAAWQGVCGDPLLRKGAMCSCSALQRSESDALRMQCSVLAACAMHHAPSRQTC